MNSITQDMKYKQSLINHALKHGVGKTARKYNRARSFIYFWLKRYDGSIKSLACKSRKPHSHPNQHTEAEKKLIIDMRRRNPELGLVEFWCRLKARGYSRSLAGLFRYMRKIGYFKKNTPKKKYLPKPYQQMDYPGQRVQIDVKVVPKTCRKGDFPEEKLYQYTAIDEYTRLRFLKAYKEQSTFSSADFLTCAVGFYKKHGIIIKCVQTDNGFEFTNRFIPSRKTLFSLFETTATCLGIEHKLIKPYTPRHNGKVERSHREDQKRFYSHHSFFSFEDFEKQLNAYRIRSNKIPMRPLNYLSPLDFLSEHIVQDV